MTKFSLALVCDFLEEQWPSMDLVGDMLYAHLQNVEGVDVTVKQWRPPMRRRFSRIPLLGRRSIFWSADRLLNRFRDYPRWLRNRTRDSDLFHIIDHSYAQLVHVLPAGRTVVSCHDLDAFRCLLEPERERRSGMFRRMTKRILDGLSRAAHILCDSETIRNEFLSYRLLPPERVSVVLHGVHPSCSHIADPAADLAAERLLPFAGPYLLHVGSSIPRKRIDVLLKIFASVLKAHPTAQLVRIGGAFTDAQGELARNLKLLDAIKVLPFLDRNVLAAVYRRSSLLLQTSDAEGFGLPVVEAMACGCPAVCSDIPVLREIGGQAAVFCPAADISAWSETVIALLDEFQLSPEAWQNRRNYSVAHAAPFSWERAARESAAVYRKLIQSQ